MSENHPVVLITGATNGIGLEAACQLAEKGFSVYTTARSDEKGSVAVNKIQARGGEKMGKCGYFVCSLEDMMTVKSFVETVKASLDRIDILLLNAGVQSSMFAKEIPKTKQGFEYTTGVNHLAHFYIVQELLPLLESTAEKNFGTDVRVTIVSSDLHDPDSKTRASKKMGKPVLREEVEEALFSDDIDYMDGQERFTKKGYNAPWAYKYSKLLNAMHAIELAHLLSEKGSKVTANTLDPGFIPTSGLARSNGKVMSAVFSFVAGKLLKPLFKAMFKQPVRSLAEGAGSELYACLEGKNGEYYHLNEVTSPAEMAGDERLRRALWKKSEMAIARIFR